MDWQDIDQCDDVVMEVELEESQANPVPVVTRFFQNVKY